MKPRLVIIMVLIVITPLAVLSWFGVKVAKSEQEAVASRIAELRQEKLRQTADTARRLIEQRQRELLTILESRQLDADTLRELVRTERAIHQIFVLDEKGQLVHPPQGEAASEVEKEFFTRTERIWKGKEIFTRPAGESLGGLDSMSGWYVWYWDLGLNLIFWRVREDGKVVGAQLDRMALLSDLVAELPDSGTSVKERIRLLDSSGRTIYEWGKFEPSPDHNSSTVVPLSYPLSAWKLELNIADEPLDDGMGDPIVFNLIASMSALALAIFGLAIYFLRASSREIRMATARVTFVNQVSHELKTPLTNIRMYAELLVDQIDEEDEKAVGYLDVIVSESQRLSRLIGNVLSFGRHQRSVLKLRPIPGRVDEAIEQIIEQFGPSLKSKGVEITFEDNASKQVNIDRDALGQILGNLLSNVEKYATSGESVVITADQLDDTTTIIVQDKGPGIPASARGNIFKPFFRISNHLTEGVSGTGIGLSISRELARLHGGDLALVNTKTGACFKVVLNTPVIKE